MQNGANSYLYSVFSKSTYPRGWGDYNGVQDTSMPCVIARSFSDEAMT